MEPLPTEMTPSDFLTTEVMIDHANSGDDHLSSESGNEETCLCEGAWLHNGPAGGDDDA